MVAIIHSILLLLIVHPGPATLQVPEPPPPPGEARIPSVIRRSGGVLQNEAIRIVPPRYPPLARQAGITGEVAVEVTIDEEGTVIATRVVSGHALLTQAAEDAARAWRFRPTKLGGRPVKVIGVLTFNFALEASRESVGVLEKRVRSNPGSAMARYELGAEYNRLERYEEAESQLVEALRLTPEYVDARCELGRALIGMRRLEEAETVLWKVRETDPDNVPANRGLAMIYALQNRYEAAIETLNGFRRSNEWSLEDYLLLGMTYSLMDRTQDAIYTFREGLKQMPDEPHLIYRLGQVHVQRGEKNSALAQVDILRRLKSKLAEDLLEEINKR